LSIRESSWGGGLLLCLFLLAAISGVCGEGASASSPTTLTVGLLSEPATLNPLAVTTTEIRDIVDRLFVKLLEEQGDFLSFEPRLARSWSFGEDSLSIKFDLRDDVRWSDGEPVTAHDVRFTWELQIDTTVAWAGHHAKEYIREVTVVDDHTAVFHFTQRYPHMLADANGGVILPRHLLAEVPRAALRTHSFGRAPVGNGPYRLARWEPGQFIELAANDAYYENPPAVDRVIFKFVPDMVALITQLKKGEIDLLESVPSDLQKTLREEYPHIEFYRYPSRRLDFVSWNVTRAPFDDADVRRALTMAINREEIIQMIWGGNAVECTGPVPPVLWAHDATIEPFPFDPARARVLLEDLGWSDDDGDGVIERDGRDFELEIVTNHGNQMRADICTMVQSYLGRIGVKVNVRTLEFRAFIDKVRNADYDACMLELMVSTKLDLTDQWHSTATGFDGYNVSFYQNPEVDRLIEEARVSLDPEKARALWSRVQRIIYDDQPYTFVAVPEEVNALHERFCNVRPNAISFFANLRGWKVAPDCE
jgi:peptide/nickel transport system substrate-binding protein